MPSINAAQLPTSQQGVNHPATASQPSFALSYWQFPESVEVDVVPDVKVRLGSTVPLIDRIQDECGTIGGTILEARSIIDGFSQSVVQIERKAIALPLS